MSALAAYEAGLASGVDCWLHRAGDTTVRLPTGRWMAGADVLDELVVDACRPWLAGTVLDIGCGPGRMTVALAERGATAVGIDISAVAVRLARERGAVAVRADVFGHVPPPPADLLNPARVHVAPTHPFPASAHPSPDTTHPSPDPAHPAGDPTDPPLWSCALLADGNIGIGGRPDLLLRRVSALLAPGGRVVADVEPDGGVVGGVHWLSAGEGTGSRIGGPLPWAWVGADALPALGAAAGLELVGIARSGGDAPQRTVATWRRRR